MAQASFVCLALCVRVTGEGRSRDLSSWSGWVIHGSAVPNLPLLERTCLLLSAGLPDTPLLLPSLLSVSPRLHASLLLALFTVTLPSSHLSSFYFPSTPPCAALLSSLSPLWLPCSLLFLSVLLWPLACHRSMLEPGCYALSQHKQVVGDGANAQVLSSKWGQANSPLTLLTGQHF